MPDFDAVAEWAGSHGIGKTSPDDLAKNPRVVAMIEGEIERYGAEFKREAVQLLESGSRPASQIARELGLRRNQLYKWQAELKTRKEGAFPGSGRRAGRTDEVSRLKRELAQVTAERDILKKAAAYFAKELR